MKWSWKLGKFAGIDVYIHTTFLLLIGFIGYSSWQQGGSLAAVVSGVGFILLLFLCVVLHEYGHALTARKFGIKTRDITLLPIGGVARLERMPDDPRQELWVALAGPAVNVFIAALLSVILFIIGGFGALFSIGASSSSFISRLVAINITLVLFNLLPAFPMDGGRVLRALLSLRLEYARATRIAARIGQGMAALFAIVGFFSNPFLLFIAFFVWVGAGQESSMVQMKASLGGIPVSRAITTDFRSLNADSPLSSAVDLAMQGMQQDFPVQEGGRVVGLVSRGDLLAALAKNDSGAPVRQFMHRDFQVIDSYDMLEAAFARLQASQSSTMLAVHNGQVVGLLTLDRVREYLAIQAAMRPTRVNI